MVEIDIVNKRVLNNFFTEQTAWFYLFLSLSFLLNKQKMFIYHKFCGILRI